MPAAPGQAQYLSVPRFANIIAHAPLHLPLHPSTQRCPSLPVANEQDGSKPQQSADAGIPIATGCARVVWSERCTSQSSRREHGGSSPCGPGGKKCVGGLACRFRTKSREWFIFADIVVGKHATRDGSLAMLLCSEFTGHVHD